ncbi:MAG: phosphatidate cytidylyltransferase [Zoogloeaceae bacterium]|jgi:phosphatidate cytidylyltransferase|nr:phosphatidate cytidylyltransferase [Zoogloeaceae bacterium]
MLKTRILTALALLAVFVPAGIWLPDAGWAILAAVVVALAAWEWAGLMGYEKKGRVIYGAGMLALMLFLYADHVFLRRSLDRAGIAAYAFAPIVFGMRALLWIPYLFWIVGVPLCLRFRWKISGLTGLLLGVVILLPFWCAFVVVSEMPYIGGRVQLLTILLIAWVADISAYFAGRAWGRHKLAPGISPGKTWEGVIGAVIGVMLYKGILLLYWSHSPFRGGQLLSMVIGAVLATAACILGDLFESLIKRQAGVKDSSGLLPGHGGILDRIDSWLPLLVLYPVMTVFGYGH